LGESSIANGIAAAKPQDPGRPKRVLVDADVGKAVVAVQRFTRGAVDTASDRAIPIGKGGESRRRHEGRSVTPSIEMLERHAQQQEGDPQKRTAFEGR
jgi:hypothetical protein